MLLLELTLRFASITLCLLLFALLFRDARALHQARITMALLIALIASSIHTLPASLSAPPVLQTLVLLISVPGAALPWWLAQSIVRHPWRPSSVAVLIMLTACLFKLGWSLQGMGINVPALPFR